MNQVPPGHLPVTVTYLECDRPPATPPIPAPDRVQVQQAVNCTVSFYRYLYNTVGEPWLWGNRRRMDDAQLAAILTDPAVAVHVAWFDGVPAGFVELDGRTPGVVAIAYFGIVPDFIGCGIGPWLLDWAIRQAWGQLGTDKLIVNTCTLDHPKALQVYLKAGFAIVEQKQIFDADPRAEGLIPQHVAPQHPMVTA